MTQEIAPNLRALDADDAVLVAQHPLPEDVPHTAAALVRLQDFATPPAAAAGAR